MLSSGKRWRYRIDDAWALPYRYTSDRWRTRIISIASAAKPETSLPLSRKGLNIALAVFALPSQPKEYAHRALPVDAAQFRAHRLRPDKPHPIPNSRRISSCGTTLPARRSFRARIIASASPAVTGSSSGGAHIADRNEASRARCSSTRCAATMSLSGMRSISSCNVSRVMWLR